MGQETETEKEGRMGGEGGKERERDYLIRWLL